MMIAGELMGSLPIHFILVKSDDLIILPNPNVYTKSNDQCQLLNTSWLITELIFRAIALSCASVPLCFVLVITQRTLLINCMAFVYRVLVLLRVVYPIRILTCFI